MEFLSKNPTWSGVSTGLMILNYPIELILLSFLSGKIFVNMADIKNKYATTVKLIIYFFLAYFVIDMSLSIREHYDSLMIPELEKEIRNKIIEMMLNKNEIRFDQIETGEMVTRFLKVPIYTFYAYNSMMKHVMPFLVSILVIGFYVLFLNWRIGLLYCAIFLFYIFILYCMCRVMIREAENKVKAEMKMFNKLDDTLSNMHTIFTSDTVEKEKDYMKKVQEKFSEDYKNELQSNARMKTIISVCALVSIIAIFLYSIHLFRKSIIVKETLISLVTLLLFLCRFIGFSSRRVLEGMVTIGSVMESNAFMDQLKKDTFADGEKTGFMNDGRIEFKDVTFHYGKDTPAIFSNFSVVVPARSRVLLSGGSGSGKTTFIRLILGFFELRGGTILIDGVDIKEIKRSYLRNRIGYINQTTKLFDRPIIDNILYGTKDKKRADVEAFLKENKLEAIFEKNHLDAMAGRSGENLSGGMRQIVLLLRCCFRDCPVIILDEATASIDIKHLEHAELIIEKMSKDRTVITVSHNPNIKRQFDLKIAF